MLAHARPEAGYSYSQPQAPSSSYGAPGGGGGGFGGGHGGGGGGGFSGGHGGGGGGGGFGGSGFGGGFGSSGFGGGSSSFSSAGSFSSGGGGGFSSGGGGGGYSQPATIQKHIYVHVPPPEPEQYRPSRPQLSAPAPQKHYKIIFIKAPTPPTPTAPVIPQFAQDEQKTLIYVLVKRPEEAPEINIPTPAPTQPSKPEVYFIRYKTQKESGGYAGGKKKKKIFFQHSQLLAIILNLNFFFKVHQVDIPVVEVHHSDRADLVVVIHLVVLVLGHLVVPQAAVVVLLHLAHTDPQDKADLIKTEKTSKSSHIFKEDKKIGESCCHLMDANGRNNFRLVVTSISSLFL